MASKKTLLVVVDNLTLENKCLQEEITKLHEDKGRLYDQQVETCNENADLQSNKTHLLKRLKEGQAILDWEFAARMKFEREAKGLRVLLKEKQAQLDRVIGDKIELNKIAYTLKKENTIQSKKIAGLVKVLNAQRGRADALLDDAKLSVRWLDDGLDEIFNSPT